MENLYLKENKILYLIREFGFTPDSAENFVSEFPNSSEDFIKRNFLKFRNEKKQMPDSRL